jgi:hypothetical protein
MIFFFQRCGGVLKLIQLPACPFLCRHYTSTVYWRHIGITLPSSVRWYIYPSVSKLVRTSPQKQQVQFRSNLTGMISTKCSWTYQQHFCRLMILSGLWPFNDLFLFLKFVRSGLLLLYHWVMQYQWNFSRLIGSPRTCAYYTGLLIEWFFAELWPLNKKGVNKDCYDYFTRITNPILMKVYRTDRKLKYLCIIHII